MIVVGASIVLVFILLYFMSPLQRHPSILGYVMVGLVSVFFGGLIGMLAAGVLGAKVPTTPTHYTADAFNLPVVMEHGEQPTCLKVTGKGDQHVYRYWLRLEQDGDVDYSTRSLSVDHHDVDQISLVEVSPGSACSYVSIYADEGMPVPGWEWTKWFVLPWQDPRAKVVLRAPKQMIAYQ